MTIHIRDNPAELPAYFTPAELAEQARVSRRTVYEWLRSGRLKGVRMGPKEWRITRAQFETFLRASEREFQERMAKPKQQAPSLSGSAEDASQMSIYELPGVASDQKKVKKVQKTRRH